VNRFVLVSTDKAVRPTNVMGTTKRVAELLTQCYDAVNTTTTHQAVRFGNVAGSAGSVIPLFKKQIEKRGVITVTHPEITRYFMTIPEAAQLILQAGAMGQGGEIFLLDMGSPIKIVDLARDLIRLSGFEPDVDIPIEFIGLRPGEKLYEELITEGEGIVPTEHQKIMVLRPEYPDAAEMEARHARLARDVEELAALAEARAGEGIREKLKAMVPEFAPEPATAPVKSP
jgi:FlaA1/EpsC-like NDP-sugar epimerase